MANQITDGRTLLDAADSVTNFDDLSGAASGTLDTEIFFQGTGSVGYSTQNTRDGLLYDAGSAQNWSSNTFYFLVNCGIVGLLATKANGGLTVRFCGATVTDWFEVRIAGSDEWPNSIAGGWTPFVVDIETARAAAITNGWTNGTTPATSAIRYVGISTVTGGTMPRMVDNTWLDAIHRLPDGTAGIIVEGRNGGSTDWNWADVVSQSDSGAWATARSGPGGSVVLSTPVQIGINDTTTHGFADTNVTLLWDDQEFVPDDLYAITALGNSGGTTNITAGIKSGAGNDATGAQGWSISAAPTGARWSLDFDDPNLDSVGLYGCQFAHGGTFQLDVPEVDSASCLFLDCEGAVVSNATIVRPTVVAAATADGVAFMQTDDLGDIANGDFQFSDGHAIEILSGGPSSQSLIGCTFSGYGGTAGDNLTPSSGSTDAALYNNSGAARTVSVSGGGNTPSVRNGASATTDVEANISVTLTGMRDSTEVRVCTAGDPNDELAGIENATAGTTNDRSFTFSLGAGIDVDITIFNENWILPPNNRIEGFTIPGTDSSIPISQVRDRNFSNP